MGGQRDDAEESSSEFDDYAEGEDGLLIDQLRDNSPDPEDFLEDTNLLAEDRGRRCTIIQ